MIEEILKQIKQLLDGESVYDVRTFSYYLKDFLETNYERMLDESEEITMLLNNKIPMVCLKGQEGDTDWFVEELGKEYDKAQNLYAEVIKRTSSYIHSQEQAKRFQKSEVQKYQIIATLDLRTCETCRRMDKKVFDVSDFKIGITAPPFHLKCRCTTVAYNGRESSERVARNPITGKSEYVDGKLDYKAWHDKYVKGNPIAEANEKMIKNYYEDRKQHAEYRELLGRKVLKNFDGFQYRKYFEPEKWEKICQLREEALKKKEEEKQ